MCRLKIIVVVYEGYSKGNDFFQLDAKFRRSAVRRCERAEYGSSWLAPALGMLVLATDWFTYLRDTPVPYSSASIVLSVAASRSDVS
jgi:hypothetical protein